MPDRARVIPGGLREAAPVLDTSGGVHGHRARRDQVRTLWMLDQLGGNQTRAAKALGIPRRTLLRRLDEWQVPRPKKER